MLHRHYSCEHLGEEEIICSRHFPVEEHDNSETTKDFLVVT